MAVANVETELKLRIDAAERERLRASPWWRGLRDEHLSELHSTYFDTDNLQLRKLGVSLRTRNKDDVIQQTMKLSGANGGSFRRKEWSAVIPDSIPDPALVIDPDLPAPVRALTAADLAPVFRIDVKRETRRLTRAGGEIEFALDVGAVRNDGKRAALSEVELELQAGDPRVLIEEARRIVDIAGGRLHFTTKPDLGYAVSGENDARWTKTPKLYLDPDIDAAGALQATLLHALNHLTSNDDCARENAHIEGVHQCRIALRRMLSALRLFADITPEATRAALEDEIGWMMSVFGPARDLDVLYADLLKPATDAVDEPEDLEPLLMALARQRQEAYRQVASMLHSARYSRFLLDAFALAVDDLRAKDVDQSHLNAPARDVARAALEGAYAGLLRKGRNFKKKSAKQRHKMRIQIKKLRYASEAMSPLFDEQRTKQFYKGLAGLQDGLGAMNDVVVAERLLAALVDREVAAGGDAEAAERRTQLSYATGCVLGWHRCRAAKFNEKLHKQWRRFQRTEPFWR